MTTPDAAFSFTEQQKVSVLRLRPQLNQVQWGEIDSIGTQVLEALESQQHPHVVVDLSELNYMGSAMVALIVRVWKATVAKKGKLSVVCPNAGVKEVFQLASLDNRFAIVDSMTQARRAIGMEPVLDTDALPTKAEGGILAWIVIPVVAILVLGVAAFLINPGLFGVVPPAVPAPAESEESAPTEDAELIEVDEVETPDLVAPASQTPEMQEPTESTETSPAAKSAFVETEDADAKPDAAAKPAVSEPSEESATPPAAPEPKPAESESAEAKPAPAENSAPESPDSPDAEAE